jgi:predicted transposase/invertase (TIGR01784 family)
MAKQDPIIGKAVDILRAASLDPQTRMQYEAREKALKDMASIRGDGLREGQIIKAKEVAKKMLQKGMDADFIAEMTGLSRSEVMELEREFNN